MLLTTQNTQFLQFPKHFLESLCIRHGTWLRLRHFALRLLWFDWDCCTWTNHTKKETSLGFDLNGQNTAYQGEQNPSSPPVGKDYKETFLLSAVQVKEHDWLAVWLFKYYVCILYIWPRLAIVLTCIGCRFHLVHSNMYNVITSPFFPNIPDLSSCIPYNLSIVLCYSEWGSSSLTCCKLAESADDAFFISSRFRNVFLSDAKWAINADYWDA